MVSINSIQKLKTVIEILDSYDIAYHLDMETLIGAVRDNDFLPNSKKVCISLTNEEDYYKMYSVVSDIRKCGYKASMQTLHSLAVNDKEFELSPYNLKGIALGKLFEIIFKYKHDSQLTWYINSQKYQVDDTHVVKSYNTVDFCGLQCKVPQNYDAYLNAIYGDWGQYLHPVRLKKCTIKDKIDKFIRTGTHEGKRFKYHCNKTQALSVLSTTIEVLNKHEVAYYLDFGTLIGAVREKGFIEWDDDIDISLLHEADYYKMEEVVSDIRRKKFQVSRIPFRLSINNRKEKILKDASIELFVEHIDFTSEHNTRVIKVTHFNRFEKLFNRILKKFGFRRQGGKSLDIFFKYKKDKKLFWMAQNKVHHIEEMMLDEELIEIYFYNLKCKIPKNYNAYLTSMYGDWETPKKDWQYYEEDMITRN